MGLHYTLHYIDLETFMCIDEGLVVRQVTSYIILHCLFSGTDMNFMCFFDKELSPYLVDFTSPDVDHLIALPGTHPEFFDHTYPDIGTYNVCCM